MLLLIILQFPPTIHGQVLPTHNLSRRRPLRLPGPRSAMMEAPTQDEVLLPRGLRSETLPRHVAVVMDGHARWARARGLPTADGHEAMRRSLKKMVQLSCACGIPMLTAFAFSHENLGRPKAEVDYLMAMFERLICDSVSEFLREGVRLLVIGDSAQRPDSLNRAAKEAEEATSYNSRLLLQLLICYSGRWDIIQACKELAQKVKGNLLSLEDIDESLLASNLKTSQANEFSYPDLIIRTSGEQRLSNFLLWQCAYSEIFFSDAMWPDFGEAEYLQALRSFQTRDRRFGVRK
ncbi:hypothetical protein EJB05_08509, partial [Eragrostis curvula]